VEFHACRGIATNVKVADEIKKSNDTKVDFQNLKPFSVYGVSVSARINAREILCYYYQFNTSQSGEYFKSSLLFNLLLHINIESFKTKYYISR
jgi:hypothetical protein